MSVLLSGGKKMKTIASYYYISYATIERFGSMPTQKTKMKGLLEILASASEYAELAGRAGEEEFIERLVRHQRFSIEKPKYGDPHVKVNALLQAHFQGTQWSGTWQLTSGRFSFLPISCSRQWLMLSPAMVGLVLLLVQWS